MTELTKTLIFVGTALVIGLVAFLTYPSPPGVDPDEEIGKRLFPGLEDPSAVARMEVVLNDDETGDHGTLRVADVDGIWTLPSHDNYPVDATGKLQATAVAVMNLIIEDVVTDDAEFHKLYGVLEPPTDQSSAAADGVGSLIVLQDQKRTNLARLIIGKKAEETGNSRYVRRAGEDRTYVVELDVGQLSAKFTDWIDKDLLNVGMANIREIVLENYVLHDIGLGLAYQGQSRLAFALDDAKWQVVALQKAVDGKKGMEPDKLAADEEVNEVQLNDLKTALRQLQIVGVIRKPDDVEVDLETGKIKGALRGKGFFSITEDGKRRVYSDSGEVIAVLDDGVEYLIQFGTVAKRESGSGGESATGESTGIKLRRHLLIRARVNEDIIRKEVDKKHKDDPKDDDKKDEPKDDKKKDDKEKEKEDAKKKEQEKADAKKKDFEDSLKEAKKKVVDLNRRFADWYYLIDEDVYKRIRLTRKDVIRKKPTPPPMPKDGDKNKDPSKDKKP